MTLNASAQSCSKQTKIANEAINKLDEAVRVNLKQDLLNRRLEASLRSCASLKDNLLKQRDETRTQRDKLAGELFSIQTLYNQQDAELRVLRIENSELKKDSDSMPRVIFFSVVVGTVIGASVTAGFFILANN
jgi:hypothetical protein